MKKNINELRKEIDSIDDDFLRLLQKRCTISQEIGTLKHENNKETFDPSREMAILERLESMINPPLTKSMIDKIFTDVFSISRALQEKKKIAFLGPEGSYSHQATYSIFSQDSTLMPQKDIESVIQEVVTSRADLGVVPIENSTEGMINRTMDLMATSRLLVIREILLPIRNCLLSNTTMGKITKVFSHPQPLAQCRGWLAKNLSGAETIATSSTSEAAIRAAKQKNSAAIASMLSAELYGLTILEENINDFQENITRFWIVSKQMLPFEGKAKTSIIVTLENSPGSLYNAIGVFARQGINLTKIESRPSKKNPWEYMFFIDFQGNLNEKHVKTAMEEIKAYTRDIIILGSYPEGRIVY